MECCVFVIVVQLNEALNLARQEVCRLHAERDRYEETMKKAFMRGVCALNMEAMTMFHDSSDDKGFVYSSLQGCEGLLLVFNRIYWNISCCVNYSR